MPIRAIMGPAFAANQLECRSSHFADSGNGYVRRVPHALVARRTAEPSPLYRNVSATRAIAGCLRFFTWSQCFDRPA